MNKKIDIKKYEGHDLAKGRVGSDYNIYDRKGNIIFDADDVGSNMATLNLLADAPLLLAEVKRLREALQIITKDLDSAIAQGHIPIRASDGIDVTKIRNFANDASL